MAGPPVLPAKTPAKVTLLTVALVGSRGGDLERCPAEVDSKLTFEPERRKAGATCDTAGC